MADYDLEQAKQDFLERYDINPDRVVQWTQATAVKDGPVIRAWNLTVELTPKFGSGQNYTENHTVHKRN